MHLAAPVTAEVGVRQLGQADQRGAGAHAHGLPVDRVGAGRDDVQRRSRALVVQVRQHEASHHRARRVPGAEDEQARHGAAIEQRRRVGVERVLRMAGRAGEEHQVASLRALHDHGRHDGHEQCRRRCHGAYRRAAAPACSPARRAGTGRRDSGPPGPARARGGPPRRGTHRRSRRRRWTRLPRPPSASRPPRDGRCSGWKSRLSSRKSPWLAVRGPERRAQPGRQPCSAKRTAHVTMRGGQRVLVALEEAGQECGHQRGEQGVGLGRGAVEPFQCGQLGTTPSRARAAPPSPRGRRPRSRGNRLRSGRLGDHPRCPRAGA